MKLRLIRVAKGKVAWADTAAADYTRRLKRYGPFEEQVVRLGGGPDKEAERVLKLIAPGDRLIALDERGERVNSHGWSKVVQSARLDGVNVLWFAIGGPDGHGPAVRERADKVLALAPMVLAHQVARVVVLEQLYRAWTLIRGEPYHR